MRTNNNEAFGKHYGRWRVAMAVAGALVLSTVLLAHSGQVDRPGDGNNAGIDTPPPVQVRPAKDASFTLGVRG